MAILNGLIAQLVKLPDCNAAKQELESFARAVYEHDDVRKCIGGGCPKRAAARAGFELLTARGMDVDDLMALMDLVEEMQGHPQVFDQVLHQIDARFRSECEAA